ncbi:NUDIX hydrolase [Zhenpiania hominis]|uniref:NUDIX hydrolase n=1 Tax=Zhenpiania hominis TaxID=2763644 RepID=UPI0039F58399
MQGYNCIMVYKDEQRKELLFCKRKKDPYKGKFNLVGGKIEPGENGFDAAYRELEEETGITREEICLRHMMDFTYFNQNCTVEVYVGVLEREKDLRAETHPLYWLSTEEDLFDLEKFAGEGNIGHMVQQVVCYGDGACELEEKAY